MNTPLATFASDPLRRRDLDENPFAQFRLWYEEYCTSCDVPEPHAMQLATVSKTGRPSVRTVLLKAHGEDGFVFYTNRRSAKARDIAYDPRVSLLFFWASLNPQIRIEGNARAAGDAEADAYFASRPRAAQIGAWASRQSSVLAARKEFDAEYRRCEQRFAGRDVPRPPFWGGYRVVPERFEFWQGRIGRAHDRLVYRMDGSNWLIERLAP